jgi:hypothetical protein
VISFGAIFLGMRTSRPIGSGMVKDRARPGWGSIGDENEAAGAAVAAVVAVE